MNVLVLGGNGFIGSNLVAQLVAGDHKVRIYDRSSPRSRENLTSVEYLQGSLNDITSVSQALYGIDIVFHLISTSIPSTSNLSPADDVRDNLADTLTLLDCMRKMNIRRILFISSGGTIYGESEKELIDEEHPLNPKCSYGIVKLAVEKYLMMYKELYGFEPMILRVSNPYGPGQGKVGLQGLIGTVLTNVIANEPVEIWGDGSVIRDYLYISDLIQACMLAIETSSIDTFNIGSGRGYTINQVIQLVEEVCSCKIEVLHSEDRDIDINRVVLDIEKAKKELGWEPNISIKEGLKKHYEWLQSL